MALAQLTPNGDKSRKWWTLYLLPCVSLSHTCNRLSFHSIQQDKRVANTEGVSMNIHNSAEEDLPSPTILLHPF